jgi:hypothetical protein
LLRVDANRIGRRIEPGTAERVGGRALNRILTAAATEKSSAWSRRAAAPWTTKAASRTTAAAAAGRPCLRERAAAEWTARSVETFRPLRAGCLELATAKRLQAIAQLTAIEVRGVAGYGYDVRLRSRRKAWRQQPRGRIGIVDCGGGRVGRGRRFRLHNRKLREAARRGAVLSGLRLRAAASGLT